MRDVLDPDQADLPAGRADDVEQDQQRDGERRPDRRRRRRRGREAGDQDRHRQQAHRPRCWCRSASTSAPPRTNPTRPGQPAHDVLPGAQRVGAQHRQRAEDDPERVLDAGEVRHQDGAPSATAPRRLLCSHTECALDVRERALLGGRERRRRRRAAAGRAAAATSCAARPPRRPDVLGDGGDGEARAPGRGSSAAASDHEPAAAARSRGSRTSSTAARLHRLARRRARSSSRSCRLSGGGSPGRAAPCRRGRAAPRPPSSPRAPSRRPARATAARRSSRRSRSASAPRRRAG